MAWSLLLLVVIMSPILHLSTSYKLNPRIGRLANVLSFSQSRRAPVLKMSEQPFMDDYSLRFSNVARLYAPDQAVSSTELTLQMLREANVCVIGLGGVGSWTVEALSRSGIGQLTLIDMDDICISNTNRQIQAMTSTVGDFKAEYLKARVLDINPHCQVSVVLDFVMQSNVDSILLTEDGKRKFDFVVEAADGVMDKTSIIDTCVQSGTPIVVSGGVGGLTDPTLMRVTDMSQVVGDGLIMRTRKRLRQKYDYPKGAQMSGGKRHKLAKWGIRCVHTLPINAKRSRDNAEEGGDSFRACDSFGNSCFSTGTAGFVMASVVVNSLMSETIMKSRPTKILPQAFTEKEEGLRGRIFGDFLSTGSSTNSSHIVGKGDSSRGSTGNTSTASTGAPVMSNVGTTGPTSDIAGDDNVRDSTSEENLGSSLVDAHCHLQLSPCYDDIQNVVSRAVEAGVSHACVCAVCPGEDWERLINLIENDEVRNFIVPQFGLHPWWIARYISKTHQTVLASLEHCEDCDESTSDTAEGSILQSSRFDDAILGVLSEQLETVLTEYPHAGCGECGLDKGIKRDVSMEIQEAVLKLHLDIALSLQRTLTLHCVNAWGRLFDIVSDHISTAATGQSLHIVLHSANSMPPEMVQRFVAASENIYFSFSGKLLSDRARQVFINVPAKRLLVETDSPDQLPTALRDAYGNEQKNEPAFLTHNLRQIADIREAPVADLAQIVSQNCRRVYGIDSAK